MKNLFKIPAGYERVSNDSVLLEEYNVANVVNGCPVEHYDENGDKIGIIYKGLFRAKDGFALISKTGYFPYIGKDKLGNYIVDKNNLIQIKEEKI